MHEASEIVVCGLNMNRTEIPRPPGVIVSVIGDNRAKANVTVSNGAAISPDGHPGPLLSAPTPRQVLVTPLTVPARARPTLIDKVLLKAVSKTGKKEAKIFTMRSIDTDKIVSRDALKTAIRGQLRKDIIRTDFDVGFMNGNSVISIRNQEDLSEIWVDLCKGKKVMLWCDGLNVDSVTGKRKRSPGLDGNETDEESCESEKTVSKKKKRSCAQDEREEQVKDTIDKLREKHGTRYSPMQFRIWSEMLQGGIHSSLTDCPTSSMFVRAGGETGTGRKKDNSIGEIVKEAAVAISSAFSSRPSLQPSSGNPLGSSPAKLIDSRSKCYKQLSDINNLKLSGILTEEEYCAEKEADLSVLRKL